MFEHPIFWMWTFEHRKYFRHPNGNKRNDNPWASKNLFGCRKVGFWAPKRRNKTKIIQSNLRASNRVPLYSLFRSLSHFASFFFWGVWSLPSLSWSSFSMLLPSSPSKKNGESELEDNWEFKRISFVQSSLNSILLAKLVCVIQTDDLNLRWVLDFNL